MRASRRATGGLCVGLTAAALILAGCGAESTPSETGALPVVESSKAGETASPDSDLTDATPRTQVESCEWDNASSSSSSRPDSPAGQDGTLQDVIIGSWQHTHINSGAGYEPLQDEDIRYVFPSSERMLYCQHVPGVLEHRDNAATFTWDGNRIALPGGAPGYTVSKWNDQTMLWINHMDNSKYLLQRR